MELNDPFEQTITTECKIHDELLFFPFKFDKEVNSTLTKFKKNIAYNSLYFKHDNENVDSVFSYSKKTLKKIINFYKNFSFNGLPVIKGSYYVFVIDNYNNIIANYKITIDHINDKVINNEKKVNDEIKKEIIYIIRIIADIYTDLDNKEYKKEKICTICLENNVNLIFKPCGHYIVCNNCFLTGDLKKCPFCRTKFTHALKCDLFF